LRPRPRPRPTEHTDALHARRPKSEFVIFDHELWFSPCPSGTSGPLVRSAAEPPPVSLSRIVLRTTREKTLVSPVVRSTIRRRRDRGGSERSEEGAKPHQSRPKSRSAIRLRIALRDLGLVVLALLRAAQAEGARLLVEVAPFEIERARGGRHLPAVM